MPRWGLSLIHIFTDCPIRIADVISGSELAVLVRGKAVDEGISLIPVSYTHLVQICRNEQLRVGDDPLLTVILLFNIYHTTFLQQLQ